MFWEENGDTFLLEEKWNQNRFCTRFFTLCDLFISCDPLLFPDSGSNGFVEDVTGIHSDWSSVHVAKNVYFCFKFDIYFWHWPEQFLDSGLKKLFKEPSVWHFCTGFGVGGCACGCVCVCISEWTRYTLKCCYITPHSDAVSVYMSSHCWGWMQSFIFFPY